MEIIQIGTGESWRHVGHCSVSVHVTETTCHVVLCSWWGKTTLVPSDSVDGLTGLQ